MTLYKILPDTRKSPSNYYALVERKTGNVIDFFNDMREALRTSKFMSSGGAFNGFTPRFIASGNFPEHEDIPPDSVVQPKQEQVEDLNSKFSQKVLRP